jgi:endoglucanase
LLMIGCLIPPPQAPSAAPGSAASIHGTGAAAAAGAPAIALKDCGPNALIDDGEDGNNQNLPNDGRGGYWYTFKDKGTTTVDPQAGEEGGTFAMSEGGHASAYAARYHGKVGTGAVVFAGLGMNFVDPKAQYDASKYSGIAFWGKRGENSTGKVRLKVPDLNTDPEGGVCSECFNDFGADMTFTTEWKLYVFPFKNMKQMVGWGAPHKPHITPSTLYGIQFQVNVPSANYDIYIDDLKFTCQ